MVEVSFLLSTICGDGVIGIAHHTSCIMHVHIRQGWLEVNALNGVLAVKSTSHLPLPPPPPPQSCV